MLLYIKHFSTSFLYSIQKDEGGSGVLYLGRQCGARCQKGEFWFVLLHGFVGVVLMGMVIMVVCDEFIFLFLYVHHHIDFLEFFSENRNYG